MEEPTILIVDDERNIIRSIARLLREENYHVLMAESGEEALQILKKNTVSVIISDQRMPGMTGTELLCKVKELYPDTVRLVLSGYTDLKTVTDAINKGAIYKFLTKPWDDELLLNNIREAFEIANLKRENDRLAKRLRDINGSLEQRIEEKTKALKISTRVLQLSQDIMNCIPVGIVGVDENEIIILANDFAINVLNARKDVIGLTADAVLPQKLVEIGSGLQDDYIVGPTELKIQGEPVMVMLQSFISPLGGKGRIITMHRKHAEQAHEGTAVPITRKKVGDLC